ncbi:MopE-related protein [Cesiribacter andamanensis]|uniref:Protein metal binding site n=1 Tax=Cesiribacter andamanensis AMV16 TaxID=1279009 RepID=M7N9C4_9BACT|nr:MopE-related protein [Cesiribacter andamanensis]EMR03781.1 Protein metal binding site [Cesiribacter andamanensis AMV16]
MPTVTFTHLRSCTLVLLYCLWSSFSVANPRLAATPPPGTSAENRPPLISISGDSLTLYEPGKEYLFIIEVSDPDPGDSFTLSQPSYHTLEGAHFSPALPYTGSGTATIEVRWTAPNGPAYGWLTAEDEAGASGHAELDLWGGYPPQFHPPSEPIRVGVGQDFLYMIELTADQLNQTYPCSETLPISCERGLGLVLYPDASVLTTAYLGLHEVRLTAEHNSGLVVEDKLYILVDPDCTNQTLYRDKDGDGYGDSSLVALACAPLEGYVAQAGDCDDENPDINPGATDYPWPFDDYDSDCDGQDPGFDADGDGVNDVWDNCPNTPNPDQYDQDFDRQGDACDWDIDGDGWANEEDCDPHHAGIHPGAEEIQGDGLDNNCNGLVDDEEALAEPQFHISASDNVIFVPGSSYLMLRPGQAATITITVSSLDPSEPLELQLVQVYDHHYHEVDMFEGAYLSPALPLSGTGSLQTQLHWTPGWEQEGDQEMQLMATDGTGRVSLYTLSVIVGVHPRILAPAEVTVPIGQFVEFNIPVSSGFRTLWTSANLGSLPLMGFEAGPGIQIYGEFGPEHIGTHQIELLAWDETGMEVSQPMLITVVASCPLQHWYPDHDADGWGEDRDAMLITSCTPIAGYVANRQDCNDYNAGIHPQAEEIPGDGLDNNCNGEVDEEEKPLSCLAAQPLKLTALCSNVASQHTWMVFNPNACAVEVRWEVHKTSHAAVMIAPPGESYFTTPVGSNNNQVVFIHWQDTQGKWKKKGMASSSAHCGKQARDGGKGKNSRLAEESEGLSLYPVPFRQQLTVMHESINGKAPARVLLISLEGRSLDVSAQVVAQGQGYLQLNLQGVPLANGLYILRLEIADQPPVVKRVLRQE